MLQVKPSRKHVKSTPSKAVTPAKKSAFATGIATAAAITSTTNTTTTSITTIATGDSE
jgi:hypothetical protein